MPDMWTPDDLKFALIRAAYLESPRTVAADLLAAADAPSARLRQVTAFQARVEAAQVLLRAGERGEGMAILRDAVPTADPAVDAAAMIGAAGTLYAETGDVAEAEPGVIRALREGPPGGYAGISALIALILRLGEAGDIESALRIAGEAEASAGRGDWPATGALGARVGQIVRLALEEAEQPSAESPAGLTELTGREQITGPGRGQPPAPPDGDIAPPPWPALAGLTLLWWPHAQYDRVVRQVPELRAILGQTWRDHTARVESATTAATASGHAGSARAGLTAADYDTFVSYLKRTGADPRLATVMTVYTPHAGTTPARWPPRRRQPCWCGSNRKYQQCCAAPAT